MPSDSPTATTNEMDRCEAFVTINDFKMRCRLASKHLGMHECGVPGGRMTWTQPMRDGFMASLKEAADEVDSWPDWMRGEISLRSATETVGTMQTVGPLSESPKKRRRSTCVEGCTYSHHGFHVVGCGEK